MLRRTRGGLFLVLKAARRFPGSWKVDKRGPVILFCVVYAGTDTSGSQHKRCCCNWSTRRESVCVAIPDRTLLVRGSLSIPVPEDAG